MITKPKLSGLPGQAPHRPNTTSQQDRITSQGVNFQSSPGGPFSVGVDKREGVPGLMPVPKVRESGLRLLFDLAGNQ